MATKSTSFRYITAVLSSLIAVPLHAADVQLFSASGNAVSTEVNNFKTAIKTATGVDGALIGWDDIKLDGTDIDSNTQVIRANKTVAIPVNRYNAAGLLLESPYAVSNEGFSSVNPDAAGQYSAFSPDNTVAPFSKVDGKFDAHSIKYTFVLPNSTIQAGTRGFGAIFIDVELDASSSIEYFGLDATHSKISLGKYFVKTGAKTGEAQFLGALFDAPVITSVELTLGSKSLFSVDGETLKAFGAEDLRNDIDLVVGDDIFFAAPEAPTAGVAKISPIDCLFNWAEQEYPSLFAPSGQTSLEGFPFYYRQYLNTSTYIGFSPLNNHAYYLDYKGIYDAGNIVGWLETSKCNR